MIIPAHVPNAVRIYFKQRMEGRPPRVANAQNPYLHSKFSHSHGLETLVATTRGELAELDGQILAARQGKQQDILAGLKEHHDFLSAVLESWTEEVAILERFVTDKRMTDVFSRLTRYFNDDENKWHDFLRSALQARGDFGVQRAKLKEAHILKSKIAKTAAELALLLSIFDDVGINGPEEFYHPPGLFDRDSFAAVEELERERLNLLAENRLSETTPTFEAIETFDQQIPTEAGISAPDNLLDILLMSSEFRQMQDLLRPSIIDIIENIASAARDYTPTLYGVAAAATQSRKTNTKTQYIRAFWHLLNEGMYKQNLVPDLIHAIAGTATVVLNGINDDVTYDDVRKALEDRTTATPQECSSSG